jgi:hypothetical protein
MTQELAGTYPEKPGKLFFSDETSAVRVEISPSFLEPTNVIPTDSVQSAAPLVHIGKTLKDQRHKQGYKDVHADDVPGDEQAPRPSSTAAIRTEELISQRAIGRLHFRKVFHELIPSFATAHAEEKDQRFWNIPKVEIIGLVVPEFGESKRLCHGDGEDQE